MANSDHFVPPTLVFCQFCEFKHGSSISFTTQSVAEPISGNCDVSLDGSDEYPASFSVKYADKRTTDREQCVSDMIIPNEIAHMVTHETRNHRTYISTPSPPQHDYTTIKNCLHRVANEETNNIAILSSNLHQIKSSVVFRKFLIRDKEARGEVRSVSLMLVSSDRFAATKYVPYLQTMFNEIIRTLYDKSSTIFESESRTLVRMPDGRRPLRSLSNLLQFSDLHTFIHQKFVKILYTLETAELPLTVVPPGRAEELASQPGPSCFCQPAEADTGSVLSRERAETLVEHPDPKFTHIAQLSERLSPPELRLILQNVVFGNQLVVRGAHPATVESVLTLLTSFLPANCVFNLGYSQRYEHCYSCRAIGLPLHVEVPTAESILVLDVISALDKPRDLRGFRLLLHVRPDLHKLLTPPPKIVDEIVELIQLAKFQETYAATLAAVVQKWAGKALSYFLFTKTHPDAASDEKKFLGIIQAGENDVFVLRNFKGALKHHEKNKLLNEVQ